MTENSDSKLVYIVEDEEDVREMYQMLIDAKYGDASNISFKYFSSAKDCYEALKEEKPYMVLTDNDMETMDSGLKLTKDIKSESIDTIVVGISGSNKESEFIVYGADEYLSKPLFPPKLYDTIDKYLEQSCLKTI